MNEQFWWERNVTDDDVYVDLLQYVRSLEEEQRDTREKFLRYAWLYDQCRLMGSDSVFNAGPYPIDPGPVTENIIESVIDTAKSLIARNRPRAVFVTDGADYETQRRAKQLEKFIEAEFRRTNIYNKAVEAFRDACVFGTGGLKIYADEDNRIAVDRVLIDEIIVDEEESRSGTPRQLHQRKFVDKAVLKALFPEAADAIDRAHNDGPHRLWTSYRTVRPHQIAVVESWHLPSGKRAKDGRHCIAIQGKTLLYEGYNKKHFPFVWYRWSKKLTGFYGRGLAEILAGLQLRINKHNRTIAKAQDLIAVPRVLVHTGDQALTVKLTNQIGEIIPWRSQKPEFVTPPAMPPEIYNEKQSLKTSAYQISGVSELSAQSRKPAGLDSGAALREYNDIETQRFSIQAQDYEQFFLEAAEHFIRVAKENYSGTTVAVWRSRNLIKKIQWADVDLDEDMYQMSIEAASILARTPAGRLQGAIEMVQSGMMKPEAALRLLGHPDLEREFDVETAAIEDIEATIENLLDGKFHPPEPFQDLTLGLYRVQMSYLKARDAGAPDDILEGLRQWMDQARSMLTPPPAAPLPGPGPGAAPAGPPPLPGMPPMPPGAMLPSPTMGQSVAGVVNPVGQTAAA